MKTIREQLRAATAEAHERLDRLTQCMDLRNPEMYGQFLRAQSGPVLALESALEAKGVVQVLPDWPLRSRRLALCRDLKALGLQPQSVTLAQLKSTAEMFGALYVLEGSRLGAHFLIQHVPAGALKLRDATAFLRHGEGLKLWSSFLLVLEENISTDGLPACIAAATKAFFLFETSFTQTLKSQPVHSA